MAITENKRAFTFSFKRESIRIVRFVKGVLAIPALIYVYLLFYVFLLQQMHLLILLILNLLFAYVIDSCRVAFDIGVNLLAFGWLG